MTLSKRLWLVPAIAFIAVPAFLRADERPTTPATAPTTQALQFIRYVEDGKGGGVLETADITFKNKDGVAVRLVSAVHIAEKSYFQSLAKEFEGDDAVLYEMVKAKDAPPPGPGAVQSNSDISKLQRFLKSVLNLEFQLDQIDYTKANFVHADLDAETFKKLQAERGESFATLMLQAMMQAMSKPETMKKGQDSMEDLIQVVTRPDMERQIKRLLARQLGDMEAMAMGLNGPKGSVILTERNKAAFKVLQDTLAAGKKKISIFYGAAHMEDMADRLRQQGFTQAGTEWHLAWDVTIRADKPSAMEYILREGLKALQDE